MTRGFVVQALCGHVAREGVRAKSLLQFFKHFKIYQMYFKIKRAYAPRTKHHSSKSHIFIFDWKEKPTFLIKRE
jgi:hypothetical protein